MQYSKQSFGESKINICNICGYKQKFLLTLSKLYNQFLGKHTHTHIAVHDFSMLEAFQHLRDKQLERV